MEIENGNAVEVRLRTLEQRADSLHTSVGSLRENAASHDTKITVISTQLQETREDIAEMRVSMAEQRLEQRQEMAWVKRGLWAAAGTFLVFIVALITLIFQVAAG